MLTWWHTLAYIKKISANSHSPNYQLLNNIIIRIYNLLGVVNSYDF